MTAQEKELKKSYHSALKATAPPSGSIRNIAEWEPMESVIISYNGSFGIPYSMIAAISQYVNLTILVANASEETSVRNLLSNNNVNLNNCSFIHHDVNSWWSRDYSPWFVAVDNQNVSVIDFNYNRPRPQDDAVPGVIANTLSMPYYKMNLEQTGGNYMTDGYGIAASTDLVYSENSVSTTQIATRMNDYLGIGTYHVRPDPLDDYIKHIDCWGKFLDVDKVMIAQVPASDYRYADFEAAAQFFATHNCSYGYPYEVVRVQEANKNSSQVTPYTNSLILNGKVFVPLTGSSYDSQAIASYQTAMPGYEIIGVHAGNASWYNTDALHCRTHGIADREMLFIKHYPVYGTIQTTNPVPINVEVYSYAGRNLQAGYPVLKYKTNNSAYHTVQMAETSTQHYMATIPVQNGLNEISYYIEATDSSGKSASNPIMGINDPFIFHTDSGTSAIDDIEKTQPVKIYPNPSNGIFNLETNLVEAQNIDIEVRTISGNLIYQQNRFVNANKDVISINLNKISSGIYFVNIKTKAGNQSIKLVVR